MPLSIIVSNRDTSSDNLKNESTSNAINTYTDNTVITKSRNVSLLFSSFMSTSDTQILDLDPTNVTVENVPMAQIQ